MKWPWKKEVEETKTDWSSQYDWYTPNTQGSTDDWSKQYDWYTPKPTPEPEPLEPSAWDKAKDTAGKVGNFIAEPFKSTPSEPSQKFSVLPTKEDWKKRFDALKNIDAKEQLKKSIDTGRSPLGQAIIDSPGPVGWTAKNIEAGFADVSNAFYRALQSTGLDKVPGIRDVLDYAVRTTEQIQAKGGTDIGSKVVRSLPGAAQNMALTLMSGGISPIGQIAATGAEAVRQTIVQMLKSPAFINAAIRSYGSGYGEAVDSGATRLQGISAGLQQALPQAMIEQAGGLEQIPNRAGEGILRTIGRSALEEAGEEILQYPFEGLAKKATYAPDTPLFSMQEQAVINPIQQAQAGLVGGIAGGVLGGGGRVVSNFFNRPGIDVSTNTAADTVADTTIETTTETPPVFYADQYGNVSQDPEFRPPLLLPETTQTAINAREVGLQADMAQRDSMLQQEMNKVRAELQAQAELESSAPAPQTIQEMLDRTLNAVDTSEENVRFIAEQRLSNNPGYVAIENRLNKYINQPSVMSEPFVLQEESDRFSPFRLTPANLAALERRGIHPNVVRQSDVLANFVPPIAQNTESAPNFEASQGATTQDTGNTEPAPSAEVYRETDPLFKSRVANWIWDNILTPKEITDAKINQTAQETIADALESTQPNILGDTETPATVKPDATERTFDTKFEVETDEGVQAYDSNDFVDDNGRTLETYVNEDPVYRELTESLKDTSSKTDNYIRNIAPEIKDKSGLAHNIDHPQRGLKNVFGKHWEYVKRNYFDPFDKSKGDYAREVITRADKIYNEVVQKHGIKKGSKESAAIQWYGEGERIVGSDRNFMSRLFRPEYEVVTNESGQEVRVPKMEKYTLDDLKRDFPTKWKDIVEAEKVFRQQYDELIDLINESRKKVYPSVDKQIEDTKQRVRDLTEDINELQGKLKDKTLAKNEANDIKRRIDDMIVKREELTNKLESGELWRNKRVPKRKNYFRHFKELNSGVTGLINIMGSPYQIDPKLAGISEFTKPKSKWASFMQQRGLGDYTADAVGGFLDYIRPASYAVHIDPHITKFRQLAKDIADGTQNTKNANNLILFLNDYANSLAGKTSKFDRLIQDMIPGGRKTFAVINWLNSRARANAVLGNLRSSITQIANMPAGIAEVNDPVALTKGMGETLANIIGAGKKPIDQSDFITERYVDSVFDKFDTKFINKPKQFAAWLLGAGDEFGTRFTWNSAYYKALKDGVPNPIKYADDLTRNVVAGRGIGEVPLMQQSKLFQTFFPFTLEVGNIAHVMKNQVKGKEFSKLMTFIVANFLFNGLAELLYGDRPLPDPIDAMVDVLSEDDPTFIKTVGRLGGEVLSNIPGGQTLASLWPEYETDVTSPLGDYTIPSRQQLFGDSDPTRYGTGFLLQEALRDPFYKLALPWGGGQLKKTVQGAEALQEGGYIKDGKLRYLVPPTTENIAKSLMFGRSATPEAREYFEKDRWPLSEQQTQAVLQSRNPQEQYRIFMLQREANKIQQQIKDTAGNQNLTMPEKDKRIRELQQKLNELWATQ